MHSLDIVTVLVAIVLLIVIGFTIYGYVKHTSYFRYALGISIVGVLGLAYFTMSTKGKRSKHTRNTSTLYPEEALNTI